MVDGCSCIGRCAISSADAQEISDSTAESIAEPKRPPCRYCGKTWWEHSSVAGIGYVCPVAVFTYEPVSSESTR